MKIFFDFEARDEGAAFFALYAGLRMYKEQREKRVEKDAISIPAAEAFCMLEDLKEQFPDEYEEAVIEYNECYPPQSIITPN